MFSSVGVKTATEASFVFSLKETMQGFYNANKSAATFLLWKIQHLLLSQNESQNILAIYTNCQDVIL